MSQTVPRPASLSAIRKVVYGSGQFGLASFGMMRQILYAIFLTDVVGLDPRLASIGALVGVVWDAVNDPLVGMLSDRLRSRWGRRRPFLLVFSVPFALGFAALWWAPPWESQAALTVYVTLAFMLTDTLGTLVAVPYTAMTPEISRDYDERTSLTSYRMFFQLAASLVTAVAAPTIVDAALAAGFTQQQGYLAAAALFGSLSFPPLLLIGFVMRESGPRNMDDPPAIPLGVAIRTAWANIPFRYAAILNMLNWMAADLVALILPYFLLYWIAGGDLNATVALPGMELSLEAGVLGLLILLAILSIPIWNRVAQRLSKPRAYLVGVLPWLSAYILLVFIQPGQVAWMLAISALGGIGLAAGYIIPEAIFPDVIEWGELLTRQRQEGIFYGIKNFVRKISAAISFFLALQVLGWAGYQAPPVAATNFTQPSGALAAIRILVGPTGATLLLGAIILAWIYPLTRERYGRVKRLLDKRKARKKFPPG